MILARCARQLPGDWEAQYGYRTLLLETLVDAQRFAGTCYRGGQLDPCGPDDRAWTDGSQ